MCVCAGKKIPGHRNVMQVREELRIQEIHSLERRNFKALLSSFSMYLRGFSRPEIKEDELEKCSAPQPKLCQLQNLACIT